MPANVVEFTRKSGDLSGGLRALADRIDAGEYPELKFIVAVAVRTDSSFTTYGWGPCSVLEAVGALARAVRSDLVDE